MTLHEELAALTQQDIAAILCERRGHADHPHGCTATINQALTVVDFRNAILARDTAPTVSDGEREGMVNVIRDVPAWPITSLDGIGQVPTPNLHEAGMVADALIAAGYRKAPVVNAEDVARAHRAIRRFEARTRGRIGTQGMAQSEVDLYAALSAIMVALDLKEES